MRHNRVAGALRRDALMLGVSVGTISKATGIDRWFVNEIKKIVDMENEIAK